VGSSETPFNVHKNFVCTVSLFFQKACNGSFKEAVDKVVYLPETDRDAFDVFMEWVYTKMINYPKWPLDKTSDTDTAVWWLRVVKLYLLAKYLQCSSL
jgi:BTB/POZ domain